MMMRASQTISGTNVGRSAFLHRIGVGIGFAAAAIILMGSAYWWAGQPDRWSSSAILAAPKDIAFHRDGGELSLTFGYVLTNQTQISYVLPPVGPGTLMQRALKTSALVKLANARWNGNISIAPHQSADIEFEIVYPFSDNDLPAASTRISFDQDASDAAPSVVVQKMIRFVNDRLDEIDGLVLFDYAKKYRIELPRNWIHR